MSVRIVRVSPPGPASAARCLPLAVLLAGAVACGGSGGAAASPAPTGPLPQAARPSQTSSRAAAPEQAPAVVRPQVAAGVSARWVVYDRVAKKVVTRRSARRTVRSASVVKLFIALDYLERRGGEVAAADARRFRLMLRSSDDKAATHFWNLGGKGAIIKRMRQRIGLADTAPPPAAQPGYWGYTAISAMDVSPRPTVICWSGPRRGRAR